MSFAKSRLTAQAQMGDPFLGGIVKGALKIGGGFLSGGPLGAIGAGVGIIRGGGAPQQVSRRQQRRALRQPALPGIGIVPLGVRRGGGPSPRTGGRGGSTLSVREEMGLPKRRRMDPLNVKAVRRATRRLAGFQREAKKVEKQLRKLAPSRGRSRRDLPRGHVHVR